MLVLLLVSLKAVRRRQQGIDKTKVIRKITSSMNRFVYNVFK